MNINQVILEGRLTRDPEMKAFDSGSRIANCAVAVNAPRKNKQTDEWEDHPGFYELEAWNREADRLMDTVKGDAVIVVGRLKWDSWEDKETGKKRSKVFVTVDTVGRQIVLNGKPKEDEEDIPF